MPPRLLTGVSKWGNGTRPNRCVRPVGRTTTGNLWPPGIFSGMDWSLRSCGRHGHVTYAPDEPELRAHLHTETPLGVAWRCLRCGDYVLGEAKASGPAALAPEVRRGKALRD